MTTNPPGSEIIWEDFEGDFENLKGTVTPPKKPWKHWVTIGACGLILVGGGITGWLYYFQTDKKIESSEYSVTKNQDIERLRYDLDQAKERDDIVNVINQALDLSKKFEKKVTPGELIISNQDNPELQQFESTLIGIQALLKFKLEFLEEENPGDVNYYNKTLESFGMQRVSYKADRVLESIPLLQTAWIKNRIKQIKKSNGSTKYIREMENILLVIDSEYSNTITGAAFQLGNWFRYKNEPKLAEAAYQTAQRYVEGYYGDSNYHTGFKPASFSPLWSEYVGSLEGLASISFDQRLYRQARSYILRMFNTPSQSTYINENWDRENIQVIKNQIENVQNDIAILEKALKHPSKVPTNPIYSEKQAWVINWLKLSDELRKTSFFSKKDPIANTIWQKVPPSLRTQILLQRGNKWLSPENKKTIISILNQLIKSERFKNKVLNAVGSSKFLSLTESNASNLHNVQLKELNTAIINRKILDSAFGSSSYLEYTLSDGVPLNQSLSPEQIRSYVHFLKQDLNLSKDDKDSKKIKLLIADLSNDNTPTTIMEFRNYLLFKRNRLEKNIRSIEVLYTSQDKHLQKVRSEIASLETLDSIDSELIMELKQNELAIKQNLLSQKFQIEKARVELRTVNKLSSSLFKSFKELLYQREARLAKLQKSYNAIKDRSLEGNNEIVSALQEIIAAHKRLMRELQSISPDNQDRSISSFQKDFDRIDLKIKEIEEEYASAPSEELKKELEDIKLEQRELVQSLDEFLTPIRTLISEVINKEKQFWEKSVLLESTRDEIASIIGSPSNKGVLHEKIAERSNLLLLDSEAAMKSPEINDKIENLNEDIDKDYARLAYLIQKELSLRSSLATFFPKFYKLSQFGENKTSENVEDLNDKILFQDNLLKIYESIWRKSELLTDLEVQENQIIASLRFISNHILETKSLNENEIYDLNRTITTLIRSSNNRDEIHKQLKGDIQKVNKVNSSAAHGFYLDATRFFEIESKLGIDVSYYEKVFSQRDILVNEILKITLDSQSLESQRVEAIKINDQLLIDQVTPQINRLQRYIRDLSKKEIELNKEIYKLSTSYLSKVEASKKNRADFLLTEENARKSLLKVQGELDSNDKQLFSTAEKISSNLSAIEQLSDKLNLNKISDLSYFISDAQKHLDGLLEFQAHLKKENYYKVKALWLLGLTFFEQSQLSNFLELQRSGKSSEAMLLEEGRLNSIVFEEFSPSLSYSIDSKEDNKEEFKEGVDNLTHSNWVLFSEDSALRVFDQIIPKYLSTTSFYLEKSDALASNEREDLYLFLSESKLLSGNIHLKRALKQLNPDTGFEPNVKLANRFLDDAINAFQDYITFIAPKGNLLNFTETTSEFRDGSPFPFLRNKKVIDRLSEAQVLLSECYFLKKDYQSSIASLKTFLNNILEEDPIYDNSSPPKKDYVGEAFEVTNEDFAYQVGLDPFYTSALSINPFSQDALFLLGLNYQTIAAREESALNKITKENPRYQDIEKRLQEYSRRSLSYYSQLINSQIYSPLRKIAKLQRSQVWTITGNYSEARSDLISLLDTANISSNTERIHELRFLRDITELHYPSKSHVLMELGKLYFENRDYEAAAESFNEAASQDIDDTEKVFNAKASYANSLYARKEWIQAAYLYRSLLQDHVDHGLGSYLTNAPDLLLNYGQTLMAISNYSDASITFNKVFRFAPPEMLDNNKLSMSNPYSLETLRASYRDSIRPLMLASFYRGEICAIKKDYTQAHYEYSNAKALVSSIPWKEDNKLRFVPKSEYQSFISNWSLKTSWSLLKLKATELFFSSFSKNQKLLNEPLPKASNQELTKLISKIRSSVEDYRDDRELFESLYKELTDFANEKQSITPSYQKRLQVEKNLADERHLLTANFQRFQALSSMRHQASDLGKLRPTLFIAELINLFPEGSFENQLANEFALVLAENLHLTTSERALMDASLNNLENMLTVPEFNNRAANIHNVWSYWVKGEISKTELDESFIPVDPEQATLTEVDLYRASCLSYIGTQQAYNELKELGLDYLSKSKASPNRVINPKDVWGVIEIAALEAFSRRDWLLCKDFYAFLLEKDNQAFFSLPSSWDLYQAELSYAESLINLSREQMSQVVYMEEGTEKEQTLRNIDEERQIAYDTLSKLKELKGTEATDNLVRIRAGELLQQVKI